MYLASDEEPWRWNRRKNTRRWCKGRRGVKHTPVMSTEAYRCHWVGYYSWEDKADSAVYQCNHSKSCENCGMRLEWRLKDKTECPHYRNAQWYEVDRLLIESIEGDYRVTYEEFV